MSRAVRGAVGVGMIVVGTYTGQAWLTGAGVAMLSGAIFEPSMQGFGKTGPRPVPIMVRSASESQPVVYGRAKMSGPLLWGGSSGHLLRYNWYVIALTDADRRIDGYEKLWLDDVEIDIASQVDGDGFVTHPKFIDAAGNKLVKCKFYVGEQSQVADPELKAAFPNDWDDDHQGIGTAYFWVRLELDYSDGGNNPDNPTANVWHKGAPREIAVTVRGFRAYDPRKDSTVGGAGAHRENNPATWEWSQNPALCIRDYLRDNYLGPGFRMGLPVAHYAAQASICDESVTVPDGSGGLVSQPRYTLNGTQLTDDDARVIVEAMLTSCAGAYVDAEAMHRVFVGAWVTPDHDIDETWLAGGTAIEPATPSDDLYNFVRGRYTSEHEDWQLVEYPPRSSAAYEAADGGQRWPMELDLPWTTDPYSAQRLAVVHLKRGRNQVLCRLECNRKAMRVALWDTVRVTFDVFGYAEKTFRVLHNKVQPNGVCVLTLREEQASDWTYELPDLDEVSFGDPILRDLGRPPAPTGLAVSTIAEGIRLTWSTPGMPSSGRTEIYRAATNDRSAAALVTRERSETFDHRLAASTAGYYWLINRDMLTGLTSAWYPVGATDGVYGIAGSAGQGPPGDPGTPALDGFVNVDGPASWVRAQDGTTWSPTATITDLDWTFRLGGSDVARISRRVTRDAAGLLTVSTTIHPGGDLNTGRVTITTTGGGTRAVTLRATYDHDGHIKTVVQTVSAALSGTDGDHGLSVAEVYAYRRSATVPAQPTGGSYSFTTQTLTPPSGWSVGIPAGTDPVYVVVATAAIQGITGDDNTLDWSSPVQLFRDGQDGQAVDIIFRRSATQPATPSPSSGVPAGWYSDVNSVPAGPEPLWSSVGTRTGAESNWTWQVAVRVEGADALTPDGYLRNGGFESGLLAPWYVSSGSAAVGSGARSGNYAALVTVAPSASSVTLGQIVVSPPPGTRLRVTGSMRRDEDSLPNRTLNLVVRFGDAPSGGNFISAPTIGTASAATGGWQTVSGIVTVPAGAQSAMVRFNRGSPFNTDESGRWYIDDVSIYPAEGEAGAPGYNTATLTAYKRSATAPADNPGEVTYTFATADWTPGNGWSKTIPAGSNPAWARSATAFANTATDVITAGEWSGAVQVFADGTDGDDGLNVATVYLFRRTTTSTPPALPNSNVTYTFATGVATGLTNDWTQTLPTTGGAYRWVTTATAAAVGASDVITPGEWAAAAILAEDGEDGAPGQPAITGVLTNESHTVAAANDGTGYSLTGAGGTFKVWEGVTDRTSSATYSVVAPATKNGLTIEINSSGVYTLSGASWTSDQESFTLRAVYGGVTSDRVYTITKSKQGPPGGAGANAPLLTVTATTQQFKYDGTGAATPASQTITFNAVLQNLTGTVTWTATRYNASGTSLGTVTLGGSGNTRTLTNAQFSDAAYCVVQASLSGLSDTITVVRTADGAAGAPGLTHSISLSDFGVACDAAGNPKAGAFDGAVGVWQVVSGTTDVTASATFAITGTSNVTAQINNSTNQNFTGPKGAYRITGITADQGHVDMTATYGGSTVQRRFTARKVRDGSTTIASQSTTVTAPGASQTTYIVASGPISIPVGAGGTMSTSFAGTYFGTGGSGNFQLVAKVQYREPGGAWTDFPSSEVTGGVARWLVGDAVWEPGDIAINVSTAGPATARVYEFQLLLRKTNTTGGQVNWGGASRVFRASWQP